MSVLIIFIKLIAVFDLLVIAVYFGSDILSTVWSKFRKKPTREEPFDFSLDAAAVPLSIDSIRQLYSGDAADFVEETLLPDAAQTMAVLTDREQTAAPPPLSPPPHPSRKNYYQIGVELANSGFEYFAGGEFQKVNGDGTGPNNHEVAAQAGYNVVTTQAGAAALAAGAGKTLIIAENLADGKAMNYAMDAAAGEWQLTDYVKKGIELLDNDKGFFLMTESGKIDWACHANDAAASIHDVLEMSNAVQAAVDFQNKHPNETLILVTADHETGGMAIGYKTTNYDTFLTNLTHQKMSYAKFDSTYVQGYIANKTPFETAMADVKANFGLTLPTDPAAASAGKLLLTDYEVENLRTAYERTLEVGSSSQSKMSQQDYELYGTYIPFSMAICHTINHKSGMDHTTYAHTGAMVNIYANGVGAENFGGVFDNTEIYHKLADLTKVQ